MLLGERSQGKARGSWVFLGQKGGKPGHCSVCLPPGPLSPLDSHVCSYWSLFSHPAPETAPPLAGAFEASRSISEIQSKAGSPSHSERGQGAAPSPSLPTPRVTPASQRPLPTEHLFPGDRDVCTAGSPRGLGPPARPGGWTSPQAQLLQERGPTNLPSTSLPPAHTHRETAAGCPFSGLFTFTSEAFQLSEFKYHYRS